LAADGIVLSAHYTHYWCSPTRRSLLSGRLPVHHGDQLSGEQTDDLDLRWKLISEKLDGVGYRCFWFGKGHTGFKSMNHLPNRRGFESFVGFLGGSQSYRSKKRWRDLEPLKTKTYSTTLFGDSAVAVVRAYNGSTTAPPLFLLLCWQAVHSPYDRVPGWKPGPGRSVYQGMLRDSDAYLGAIVAEFRTKNMWADTLLVYSSDNGGRGAGINYPLRGKKATSFEGGMRVAAFVSGGLVPPRLRGTQSVVRLHIVDWYPTFCALAGAEPTDDPPVPPLPVDPALPDRDIYGNFSYPGVDGVNVWPFLTQPENATVLSAHPTLVLSKEVIMVGTIKLITALRGDTDQDYDPLQDKWQQPDGTWWAPPGFKQECGKVAVPYNKTLFTPCLYDLATDTNETTDLSAQFPKLRDLLWAELNRTYLAAFHARSPAWLQGHCDTKCANKKWKDRGGKGAKGPMCGVPGCNKEASS